jgi:hypothetical protein
VKIIPKVRKIPMTKGLVYFAFLVIFLLMCQARVNAAELQQYIDEGPIPDGYKTYTLFLIPDEKWVTEEKDEELNKLFKDFLKFGRVIGDDNLAVWFRSRENNALVDISHNQKYCKKFGLPYLGPFIIISKKNPDINKENELAPDDYYRLNLNGITSSRITEILDYLGNSIRSGTFRWDDTLNTSPVSFLRFRYPVRAAMDGLIKEPGKNLNQIISKMNNLPLEEKKLNVQIRVILLLTLLISTFLAFKNKRIKLREQPIGESVAIFFIGVVCYYVIYDVIFFEYIGDTLIVLVLTAIYGLIPQRIVKHIPTMKKIVTYTPS